MADLDVEYLKKLRGEFLELTLKSVQEQADVFKTRYVLSIGEHVLAIDDQVAMFCDLLPPGQISFEYNDPNLSKFLDECNVQFESFLVRNQEFMILNPNVSQNFKPRLSFVEFLCVTYKQMILEEYCERWKIQGKTKKKILGQKDRDHAAMGVYSELLDQPPYGVDSELDELTKEERETKVNYLTRTTQLEHVVEAAKSKDFMSVKEKQALHQLEALKQTNIEEDVNIMRAKINKLSRKLMLSQKDALKQLKEKGFYNGPMKKKPQTNVSASSGNANNSNFQQDYAQNNSKATNQTVAYVPPPGWVEYIDDASGAYYYYNQSTGVTQWDRP